MQAAEREEELARERVRVWKEQWLKSQKTGGGEESDSEDDQHRTNQRKGNKCKEETSDDEAEPLLAKSKRARKRLWTAKALDARDFGLSGPRRKTKQTDKYVVRHDLTSRKKSRLVLGPI